MAFIFSDLVVLPVLRINAAYYGWKMSLYILLLLLSGLVLVSIIFHYVMVWLDVLPQIGGGQASAEQEFFSFDYRFVLILQLYPQTILSRHFCPTHLKQIRFQPYQKHSPRPHSLRQSPFWHGSRHRPSCVSVPRTIL
jgi:hypothetical protein